MGLNFADFPALGDDDGNTGGLTFLGSDKLSEETTNKIAEAAAAKQEGLSKGQRSAVTRKINKAKREGKLFELANNIGYNGCAAEGLTEEGAEMVALAVIEEAPSSERDYALRQVRSVLPVTDLNIAPLCDAVVQETDPSGLAAGTPGAKLDAGKVDIAQILSSFPRALFAVGSVGKFGAEKYSFEGWLEVSQGVHRYSSAGLRHFLKQFIEGPIDSDSKLHHLAHEAWNALAKLELYCRENNITGEFNTWVEE